MLNNKTFKKFISLMKKADHPIIQRKEGKTIITDGYIMLYMDDIIYTTYFNELPFPHCEENEKIQRYGKKGTWETSPADLTVDRIISRNNGVEMITTNIMRDTGSNGMARYLISTDDNFTTAVQEKFIQAFNFIDTWYCEGSFLPSIGYIGEHNDPSVIAVMLPLRVTHDPEAIKALNVDC